MDSRPDLVEELMATCLDRRPQEWAAAVEEACAQHPLHADELRARMRMVAALDESRAGEGASIPERLGDFQLLERIGGGGMGVVYRARQESLGREVALKIVRPEQLWFDNARTRFARETEAIARLRHPGILQIHTVGEQEGLPFFAMELLEGATLAEVLRRVAGRAPESLTGRDLLEAVCGHERPPRDVPELFRGGWVEACLALAVQLARALEHAHGRGILHRDVKPSNVMLGPDGRAVLLDFGLTSSAGTDRLERVTRSGSPVGTLVYMSPEQVEGADLDARADLYSLAVTLYELLTLQVPHQGRNVLEIQSAILAGSVDSIRARNRRVSEDAQTVCLKAMQRAASDRYSDLRSFAQDLERVLDRRPIEARPPGALKRTQRWVQRNRTLSAALVLGAAAFGGIPLAMWRVERANAAEVTRSLDAERSAKQAALDAQVAAEGALAAERAALAEAERLRLEADAARVEAQSKADEAMAMLTFLDTMLQQAKRVVGGALPDARQMLDASVARLDELEGYPRARMQMTLGAAFYGLALYADAAPLLDEAITFFEAWEEPAGRQHLTYALWYRGRTHTLLGNGDQAVADLRRGLELAREVHEPGSTDLERFFQQLAEALDASGMPGSVDVRRSHVEHLRSYRPDDELALVKAQAALGHSLLYSGQPVEGAALMEAATARMRELADPLDQDLIQAILRLGNVPLSQGDHERARALFQEGVEKGRARWGEDGDPALVLGAEVALVSIDLRRREFEAALPVLEELLPRLDARLGRSNNVRITALHGYVGALFHTGRYTEVIEQCLTRGGIEDFRGLYGPQSPHTVTALRDLVGACLALERWRQAADVFDQLDQAYPDSPLHRRARAQARVSRGQLLAHQLQESEAARDAFQAVLALVGDERCVLQGRDGLPAEDAGIVALRELVGLARAQGWEQLGAWERALADRREALER